MSRRSRSPVLALGSCMVALIGCATKSVPLYMWDNFPRQQYAALQREATSPEEQIRVFDAQAEKARSVGAALPPGFRAHLGMLHLNAGNIDQARMLWRGEKVAFPESAPYMDQLLKRLKPSAPEANRENPA